MLQPKINKSTHNAYITKIIFSQIKVFLRYLISKYFFGRDWNRDTKKINEIYDELRSKKEKGLIIIVWKNMFLVKIKSDGVFSITG